MVVELQFSKLRGYSAAAGISPDSNVQCYAEKTPFYGPYRISATTIQVISHLESESGFALFLVVSLYTTMTVWRIKIRVVYNESALADIYSLFE